MTPDETTDRAEAVRERIDDAVDTVGGEDEERVPDIPEDAVAEAERLTRLARAAEGEESTGAAGDALADPDAYRERRAEFVGDYGYESRIREEDDTLVLYPEEWLEDGVVQFDRVEETDRAVEILLSGAGNPDQWQKVADHNEALAEAVAEEHGEAHGANARAFTAFVSNHYAKEVERVTEAEIEEFLTEYYPRNAWPSEAEASLVEESVEKLLARVED